MPCERQQALMHAMMEMYAITVSESVHFKLPILGGRGTPTGIDVFKVLEKDIYPYVTTGIAHKLPGMGQIGAGRVRAPRACFEQAAEACAIPVQD